MEPNDPLFRNQWGLGQILAPLAWEIETGNRNVTIAIIDSGMSLSPGSSADNPIKNHPDLKSDRFIKLIDFTRSLNFLYDEVNHGTAVLGVVAADTNNLKGIAGMNWGSDIIICKATGRFASMDAIFRSLDYLKYYADEILKNHRIVINMSFSVDNFNLQLLDKCKELCEKGMIICAAVGNNSLIVRYPAALSFFIPAVIAVGATKNVMDAIWDGSNTGDEVTVVAPGANILTTTRNIFSAGRDTVSENGYYQTLSGTSLSTPFVTGLVSLIWSKYPELTNVQVVNVIKNTTRKLIQINYPNEIYGHGCINAVAALRQGGWDISVESPRKLEFKDVKEGETRVLDLRFSVKSFHATAFEITSLSNGFLSPHGKSASIGKTTDYYTPRFAYLRILYKGTKEGDHPSGKATVRCIETGEEWHIDLSANTVA